MLTPERSTTIEKSRYLRAYPPLTYAVASVFNPLERGLKAVLVTHGSNVVENGKQEVENLVAGLPADRGP